MTFIPHDNGIQHIPNNEIKVVFYKNLFSGLHKNLLWKSKKYFLLIAGIFLNSLNLVIAQSVIQIGDDINGEAAGDLTGFSVSLSSDGTVLAVGSPYNDENGRNSGHVRIYQNIAGTWTQIGVDIEGEGENDYSAWSISLNSDGNIVAIGAPANGGNVYRSGHVRIYQNLSGTWTQIGSDINGEAADDMSGLSVCLRSAGNIVAIGAKYNDGNGNNSGHVRVFEYASLPTIITTIATSITNNSAESGGNVTDDGGCTVTNRGVCRSTTSSPTINDNTTSNGTGNGTFTSSITGLEPGTTYYYRAYATNCNGTAYGEEYSFTTLCIDATAPTSIAGTTNICPNSDTELTQIGGQLNDSEEWQWYSGSCGGTHIGSGTNITVNPEETTEYFVRGEGNCTNPGNCASVVITVIEDNTAPEITCPTNVTVNNSLGNCHAVVNNISPINVSDNCSSPVVTYLLSGATTAEGDNDASGNNFNAGETTVQYTATDEYENSGTCSFTVTVNDTESPVAITQNLTIELDENGNSSITPEQIDNNSADNCNIAELSLDINEFTCNNIGENTVNLTVRDNAGNSNTASAVVTIVDNTAPVFNNYEDIIQCTDNDLTTAIVEYPYPTGYDVCSDQITVTQISGLTSGSVFPAGTNPVTFEMSDEFGNASQLTFNIAITQGSVEPESAECIESPYCVNSLNEITLSYSGGASEETGTSEWYTDTDHTNLIGTGNNISVPAPAESATYYIRFTGNCNITDLVPVEITVNPLPVLEITPDFETLLDEETQLEATYDDDYTYLWNPAAQLDNPEIYDPVYTADYPTTLILTVTDENNCTNQASVSIGITDYYTNLVVYNAITPNGDGKNDTWFIEGLRPFDYIIRVRNRAGFIVYESSDYNNDRDGTDQRGRKLSGPYFYTIEIMNYSTLETRAKKKHTGTISILR